MWRPLTRHLLVLALFSAPSTLSARRLSYLEVGGSVAFDLGGVETSLADVSEGASEEAGEKADVVAQRVLQLRTSRQGNESAERKARERGNASNAKAKAKVIQAESLQADPEPSKTESNVVFPVVVVGPLMAQDLDAQVEVGKHGANLLHKLKVPVPKGKLVWMRAWNRDITKVANPKQLQVSTVTLGMDWNDTSKVATCRPGVRKVLPKGGTRGFAAFDVKDLIKELKRHGYKTGKTLIGHPYDWRQSVRGWEQTSFQILREDIEAAFKLVGRKVLVASVSMGGLYFHAFLQYMGKAWSKKHIELFMPFAAPFNGAVQSLMIDFSRGDELASDPVVTSCPKCMPPKPKKKVNRNLAFWAFRIFGMPIATNLLPALKTTPSFYYVMPGIDSTRPQGDSHRDPQVVTYNGKVVKASETPELLAKFGNPTGAKMLKYAQAQNRNTDPGVPVHCVYEVNVKTPKEFNVIRKGMVGIGVDAADPKNWKDMALESLNIAKYQAEDPQPVDPRGFVHGPLSKKGRKRELLQFHEIWRMSLTSVVEGDGDGVVSRDSLEVCSRWKSTVASYRFRNFRHTQSTTTKEASQLLAALAMNDTAVLKAWKVPSGNINVDKRFDSHG